jgi:hypothetical protein
MGESNTFYRVCHKKTLQGLWYDYKGDFTGLIHDRFDFCTNTDLRMDFDPEIVGWLSATDSLEKLWQWFSKEDILKLQRRGWYIHRFEAKDVKFYERFQHLIINQETSRPIDRLVIEDRSTGLLTIEDIRELRPEFKLGGGPMSMVEWFEVTTGHGFCSIRSGLRHADGETRSPFHYEDFHGGEDAEEVALVKFNKWWDKQTKEHGI